MGEQAGPVSKNLTIMFTDISGYTAKTSTISRQDAMALLQEHRQVVSPFFQQFGGTIIKEIGDAFLVVFESPTNAVLAGVSIQTAILQHNQSEPDPNKQFMIKVAINSGEVSMMANDVFGEPVNIASRLEGISEPGEVYFTEAVYLSMNKSEIPSCEMGYRILKGIPDKIKVFKVLREKPATRDPLVTPSGQTAQTAQPAATIPPVLPAQPGDLPPATFFPRAISLFLDVALLWVCLRLLAVIVKGPILHKAAPWIGIAFFLFGWLKRGATPGMQLLKLTIRPVGLATASLWRGILRFLLLFVFFTLLTKGPGPAKLLMVILCFWPYADKEGRPLLDRISGLGISRIS